MYINEVFQKTLWYKPYCNPIDDNIYSPENNKSEFEFIYVIQDIPYYNNPDNGFDLWYNDFITKYTISRTFIFHDRHVTDSDIFPFTIYHLNPNNRAVTKLSDSDYTFGSTNNIVTINESFFINNSNGLIYASYVPLEWDTNFTEYKNLHPTVSLNKKAPALHANYIIRIRTALNDIITFINNEASSNIELFSWTGGYNNTLISTSPQILNSYSLFSLVIINELINAINTIKNNPAYLQTIIDPASITKYQTITPIISYEDTADKIFEIQTLINNIETEILSQFPQ